MNKTCQKLGLTIGLTALFFSLPASLRADDAELRKEIETLRQQNTQLQAQLEQQKAMLEQISRKVSGLQTTNEQRDAEWQSLKTEHTTTPSPEPPKDEKQFNFGNVHLGAEGGLGIFESGKNGQTPNSEFRLDELKLFLEAPIWDDIYFFSELNLMTHEAYDENIHLGEVYLDFENLAKFWKEERLINVRLGRFYIPFGEEYQTRNDIDNPLISRSIMDLWGVDEGIEIYGSAKKFSYAVAVQNGNNEILNDGNGDKSVAIRLCYDPNKRVHLSASAMRTGTLDAVNDGFSAMWIGNGFFHPISFSPAATHFHANLAELDASYKWKSGHVKVFGGYAEFDDNDPASNNQRDIYYYSIEALQDLTKKLYIAARFSELVSPRGYPFMGNSGNFSIPTRDLWRLSMGVGYRMNKHLVLKGEYSLEHGRQSNGTGRNGEDMLSAEAAFKF